jgi:hypothetical protein
METMNPSVLQTVDLCKLTPIIRQASGWESLQIQDWHVTQLGGGAGNPVSLGLYRIEGAGQAGDEQVPWSVILKIIQSPANIGWQNMGEGEDQSHWNYWKRELLVYQSGLFGLLPEGMVAPRCFGVEELPGDMAWLWLEDIRDSLAGAWSLERYALAARHLGRMNGMLVSDSSLPDFPWLSLQRNQQWINTIPMWQTTTWEHPLVRERYPEPDANPFRRMLLDNERFLVRLNQLPGTICHGDTYPTNFMSRQLANGEQQTVALDWALVGFQPLGDDLGQFVYGAQMNLKGSRAEDVTEELFENYLDGLRDSGCRVDPQWVRFGFVASAALRVGLFQLILLGEEMKNISQAPTASVERTSVPDCFEVTMANEAFQLLELIG